MFCLSRRLAGLWALLIPCCWMLGLCCRLTALAAEPDFAQVVKLPSVENVRRVADGLYSGGDPQGPAAFAALAKLGVKTVVSVDGAAPDAKAAAAAGLRYVHLPIGYDGIPRERALGLVRVMREAEGPVFVHCHHGKHRGPAAAAVCGLAAGKLTPEEAQQLLKVAGTDPDYRGLYRDVAQFEAPALDVSLPELRALEEVEPLAGAMSRLDRQLEAIAIALKADADFKQTSIRTDAAAAAILVTEAFDEAARVASAGRTTDFVQQLSAAGQQAAALHAAVKASDGAGAAKALDRLRTSCKGCHREYRDKGANEE